MSDFDGFWEAFWIKKWSFLYHFSETAILWKIASRLYETIIFKGRRLQKSIKNRSENGIENHIKIYIEIWSIFDRKKTSKCSPRRPGASYFCSPMLSEENQKFLKSPMDPFSWKSQLPDVNFMKKVTPNLKIKLPDLNFIQQLTQKFNQWWTKLNEMKIIKFQKKSE